jgi:hypothetical protein
MKRIISFPISGAILAWLCGTQLALAQDTLRLQPLAEIDGTRIHHSTNDKLFVIEELDVREAPMQGTEYDSLAIYDITSRAQPRMIARIAELQVDYVMETWDGECNGGGILFDSLAIFNRYFYAGSVGLPQFQRIGPICLEGTNIYTGNRWTISVLDTVIEEWLWDWDDPPLTQYWLPRSFDRYGDYLIANCGSWGLRLYDLSNPSQPDSVASLNLYGLDEFEVVDDRLIYVRRDSSYHPLLGIVDLQELNNPLLLGEIDLQENNPRVAGELQTSGGYAYFSTFSQAAGQPHLIIFNVTNQDTPSMVSNIQMPYDGLNSLQIMVIEEYLFVERAKGLFDVFKIEDPLEPQFTATVQLADEVPNFELDENLLYAFTGDYEGRHEPTYIHFYDYSAALSAPPSSDFIPYPSSLILSCYPNPFNSSTTIRFNLPRPGLVHLEVYDPLGRRVRELIPGSWLSAGEHSLPFNRAGLSSGMYILMVGTGDYVSERKVTLVR